MTYHRVIPRDLFNEANLLKCYGQLWLELERRGNEATELLNDGDAFDIVQDSDGNLTITNIEFFINEEPMALHRPLNSKEPWPLYLTTEQDEIIAVFTDRGLFTQEMLALLPE